MFIYIWVYGKSVPMFWYSTWTAHFKYKIQPVQRPRFVEGLKNPIRSTELSLCRRRTSVLSTATHTIITNPLYRLLLEQSNSISTNLYMSCRLTLSVQDLRLSPHLMKFTLHLMTLKSHLKGITSYNPKWLTARLGHTGIFPTLKGVLPKSRDQYLLEQAKYQNL